MLFKKKKQSSKFKYGPVLIDGLPEGEAKRLKKAQESLRPSLTLYDDTDIIPLIKSAIHHARQNWLPPFLRRHEKNTSDLYYELHLAGCDIMALWMVLSRVDGDILFSEYKNVKEVKKTLETLLFGEEHTKVAAEVIKELQEKLSGSIKMEPYVDGPHLEEWRKAWYKEGNKGWLE